MRFSCFSSPRNPTRSPDRNIDLGSGLVINSCPRMIATTDAPVLARKFPSASDRPTSGLSAVSLTQTIPILSLTLSRSRNSCCSRCRQADAPGYHPAEECGYKSYGYVDEQRQFVHRLHRVEPNHQDGSIFSCNVRRGCYIIFAIPYKHTS